MIARIVQIFRSIMLIFATTFKKALCFLNRKRRNSGSILPTHIEKDTTVPNQVLPLNSEIGAAPSEYSEQPLTQQNLYAPDDGEADGFVEWDSWDKVTTVHNNPGVVHNPGPAHHTNPGRPTAEATPAEPPPEPDYFSDLGLAPTIKKQKKVFVKPSHQELPSHNSDRLSFKPDAAIPMSAELGDWDDVGAGWEGDDLNLDSDEIKQTRRAELERRRAEHQRRNQEKEAKRHSKDTSSLATRLS